MGSFPVKGEPGYESLPTIPKEYWPILYRALLSQSEGRPAGDTPQLPVRASSNVGPLGLALQGFFHGGAPAGDPRQGYLETVRQ